MGKRKQYIVDKQFQLNTTFKIIGTTVFLVGIAIMILAGYISYMNGRISNIIQIEDNIVGVLTVPTPESTITNQNFVIEMAQKHQENMEIIKMMQKYSFALTWMMAVIIFIQGIVLYFVLIRQTHKIAGPIFVMTRYMKEIIDGKIPEKIRPLRDNDKLQDFYKTFSDMVNAIRSRQKK